MEISQLCKQKLRDVKINKNKMAVFQRTRILSYSIWIRYLSSSDITLRHVNPFRLKKDQIVQEIFTQLQPKYLPQEPKVDTKEMNKIMDQFKANLNEDDKCLEIYKSYGQNSKLAFYLLANPDLKPDFLVKLVKHMSSIQTSADAQDMVALWLTLYMTKKLWNVEELYENFDFTKFQFSLSNLLEKRQISSLELQLIFHGMKRVQGLNLYHPVLRKSLYKYLINCAIVNEEHCEELILTILPIMQRSDEIQKDDKKLIFQLLHAFASISSKLSITALIQIVNYGISKKDDVYDGLIHEELINRIQSGDLKFLSVNEIKKLTKYLSRIPEEIDGSISQLICNELELVQDEDCQLTDTRDIVHSLCYLALSFDTVSVKLVSKIFEAVNSVSSNELKSKLPKELSKELLFVVHQNLFPQSAKKLVNLEEQFKSHFVGVSDSFFCRLLVNIQQVSIILPGVPTSFVCFTFFFFVFCFYQGLVGTPCITYKN